MDLYFANASGPTHTPTSQLVSLSDLTSFLRFDSGPPTLCHVK